MLSDTDQPTEEPKVRGKDIGLTMYVSEKSGFPFNSYKSSQLVDAIQRASIKGVVSETAAEEDIIQLINNNELELEFQYTERN